MPPRSVPQNLQELRKSYATLNEEEVWWRNQQEWLQQKGYMLRPRYRPGWKPSWEADEGTFPPGYEDGVRLRVSDTGAIVLLC